MTSYSAPINPHSANLAIETPTELSVGVSLFVVDNRKIELYNEDAVSGCLMVSDGCLVFVPTESLCQPLQQCGPGLYTYYVFSSEETVNS